jgi:hypothetical protein
MRLVVAGMLLLVIGIVVAVVGIVAVSKAVGVEQAVGVLLRMLLTRPG